jgi:hypothetical protein
MNIYVRSSYTKPCHVLAVSSHSLMNYNVHMTSEHGCTQHLLIHDTDHTLQAQ